MSTASTVPETYELEHDDARETLRSTGNLQLAKSSFQRFRAADGFSHSRALAFQIVLTFVPGLIALVGLTVLVGQASFRRVVQHTLVGLAPGPAAKVLTQAFGQGGGTTPLLIGLIAALVAGTTAMGQLERGANRIYGVEKDRPTLQKYGRGFVLACTAGVLGLLGAVFFVAGSSLGSAGKSVGISDTLVTVWEVVRWPLGIALVIAAFAVLFKKSPRRTQPSASWLVVGSAVSVGLWIVFTALLSIYLTASKSFGQTYGPLAGFMGILLWAFLTSLALYLGLAFAAQLEAVRAGVPSPHRGEERESPTLPRDARPPQRA
jgi:YihY family inner membrane protein